jgi:two-component system sensor histidine kinase UhpB
MVSSSTVPMPVARPAEPARAGWSLRLRLNLIVASLMTLFVAALFWLHVDDTRRSVHEEISGGNRVATQLLQRVSWIYQRSGPPALLEFLTQLGRVRANEITLSDAQGAVLYRSPPSPYKAGRFAPEWFTRLVAPPLQRQEIVFAGGRLVVEADPSRAILDGWDDLWKLAAMAASVLLVLNLGLFWLVGRTLAPLVRIEQALARIQAGDWASRLPALPGREAARMGAAVNRMAEALQGQLDDQKRAWAAERSLHDSRELAWQIEQHMEAERREIARELHDELGQSVTAIRSLAASLVQRLPAEPGLDAAAMAWRSQNRELAALIGAEASRLDDAMHSLIPRLAPLTLDAAGLVDALADLVAGARQREPGRRIELQLAPLPAGLGRELTLTAYRVAQEGLNNALRHSGAGHIIVSLGLHDGRLLVRVADDGRGLGEAGGASSSRYGLRGLRERVRAVGGELALQPLGPAQPAGPDADTDATAADADAASGRRRSAHSGPGCTLQVDLPLSLPERHNTQVDAAPGQAGEQP